MLVLTIYLHHFVPQLILITVGLQGVEVEIEVHRGLIDRILMRERDTCALGLLRWPTLEREAVVNMIAR